MDLNKENPEKETLQRWVDVIAERSLRVGEESPSSSDGEDNPRNQYQRDFDRLIFSSAFKRLQNKTQVFPLPGTAQVHNRLTHSLEVSSVGRSLGSLVGNKIATLLAENNFPSEVVDFYRHELRDVILAACLAHDIGNPCFGHSGEKILSDYFCELKLNPSRIKGREKEFNKITPAQWADLCHFEGNANTLRMLTAEYYGKLPGGLQLTYLTLASILKYPWDAVTMENPPKNLPTEMKFKENKYGFFQEQEQLVDKIADCFNLGYDGKLYQKLYRRHPFVYLVEVADDICYNIMDMEDAQKIGVLSVKEVRQNFWDLYREMGRVFLSQKNLDAVLESMEEKEGRIKDEREKIVYLRSKCINILTEAAAQVFMDNREKIVHGKSRDLFDLMIQDYKIESLKKIKRLSEAKIYNYNTVTETMVGASHILPELLDWFLPSVLAPDEGEPAYREKKIFSLINSQYTGGNFNEFQKTSPYKRILSLLDFLTGMTDAYIIEYYRKLKGIDHPKHSR